MALLNITVVGALGAVSGLAVAGREMADSTKTPIAKAIVQITQENDDGGANGFIVGSKGCHVVTNFHVAYGRGSDADGQPILVDRQEVGHVVNIGIDFDSKSGTFRRKVKARVVDFGNFEAGTKQGLRGDIAVLRLEDCLGPGYALLKLEKPVQGTVAPSGLLSTVSFEKRSPTISALYVEKECGAARITPVVGLFLSTCETIPGMSGSPVVRLEKNGSYSVVGMNTGRLFAKDGTKVPFAIHSSILTPFVAAIVGE